MGTPSCQGPPYVPYPTARAGGAQPFLRQMPPPDPAPRPESPGQLRAPSQRAWGLLLQAGGGPGCCSCPPQALLSGLGARGSARTSTLLCGPEGVKLTKRSPPAWWAPPAVCLLWGDGVGSVPSVPPHGCLTPPGQLFCRWGVPVGSCRPMVLSGFSLLTAAKGLCWGKTQGWGEGGPMEPLHTPNCPPCPRLHGDLPRAPCSLPLRWLAAPGTALGRGRPLEHAELASACPRAGRGGHWGPPCSHPTRGGHRGQEGTT